MKQIARLKLLHISNNFSQQKIYVNLVRHLENAGFSQIVYTAVRNAYEIDGNRDDSLSNVEYYYAHILSKSKLSRLFYFGKLRKIQKDIEAKVNLKDVSLIHAHFLFSDGGVAYLMKQKYGIPYIISVRSSDLVAFFKYMLHLRQFGNEIMMNAEKVIFISHAYKNIFFKKYVKKQLAASLKAKSVVIPNAIDQEWFNNEINNKELDRRLNLIYVGRIIKRKKLGVVINAVEELNKIGIGTKLHVVGEGNYKSKMMKIADGNTKFLGAVYDLKKLVNIYKNTHIFVMPSIGETFGLVYIEALSQGLPIIYCKNESVDGFFNDEEIGFSVKPNSAKDVADKILKIRNNYDLFSSNAKEAAKKFTWKIIGRQYEQVYKSILGNNDQDKPKA